LRQMTACALNCNAAPALALEGWRADVKGKLETINFMTINS